MALASDQHGGHSLALFPPNFETNDGQLIGQSKSQKWLWACWLDYCSRIPRGSIGVLNGEIVTGSNPKDSKLLVFDEADQIEVGVQIVAPFIGRCDEIWITYGTEFHDMPAGKLARQVWKALKEKFRKDKEIHKPEYELWLPWNGERIHVTHHQGVSGAASSKATFLNKSLIDMLIEAPCRGGEYPTVVVRSHAHQIGLLELPIGWSIGLGSWQLKTPLVFKRHPAAPEIVGGAILQLDEKREMCPKLIKYSLGKPRYKRLILQVPKRSSGK